MAVIYAEIYDAGSLDYWLIGAVSIVVLLILSCYLFSIGDIT